MGITIDQLKQDAEFVSDKSYTKYYVVKETPKMIWWHGTPVPTSWDYIERRISKESALKLLNQLKYRLIKGDL